jgi:hypothetical protein
MFLIVKIVVLVALARLLLVNQRPLLCAGIYTAVSVGIRCVVGQGILAILIGGLICFALSSLFFWLLDRYEDNLAIYFLVCAFGFILAFV